ncbi:MAG: hypothetical protein V4683_07600 [Bacteroidota bacterium]
MLSVNGIYFNGKLQLEKPINSKKPLKVVVNFEEIKSNSLSLNDFSFVESQELLKDYKGSFSDEVIEERRGE